MGTKLYRVEWLGRNDKQYIDTGVMAGSGRPARMEIHISNFIGNSGWIAGARESSSANKNAIFTTNNSDDSEGNLRFSLGGVDYYYNVSENEDHILELQGDKIFVDRTLIMNYPLNVNKQIPIFLFAMNLNGSPSSMAYEEILKIKEVIMWNSRGTLVRHLIPVVKNGKGCMYDTINDKFYYNKRGSDFMVGNRYNINTLPYDYEVEYIYNTTAGSFINTGFEPTQNTKIWMKVEKGEQTKNKPSLFGCCESEMHNPMSFYLYWNSTNVVPYIGSNMRGIQMNLPSSNLCEVTCDRNGVVVGDSTYTPSQASYGMGSPAPILLFSISAHYGGFELSDYMFVGKLYGCKIWDNGVLVRDFIPVSVGGIGALYDKVTKFIYNSKGENQFIAGNRVD